MDIPPALRLRQVRALCRQSRWREAVYLATAVLRVDPGSPAARQALGRALLGAGRRPEAEAVLAAAWAEHPTPSGARLLAEARARTSGEQAALEAIRQGLARFPRDAALLAEEAGRLRRLGRGAGPAPIRSPEGAGGPDPTWVALRAAALPPAEAASELEAVLHLPRFGVEPRLWRQLALALEQAERPDDAVAAWRTAAARAPGERSLVIGLAYALRRCGYRREAQRILRRLIAEDPHDPRLLSAYVADARALGRVGAARRFLLGLVREDPERRRPLWGFIRRLSTSSNPDPERRRGAHRGGGGVG